MKTPKSGYVAMGMAFIALTTSTTGARAQGVNPISQCPANRPLSQWSNCIGTWTDPAGDLIYSGEFRAGQFHGYGMLRTGGGAYVGEFQDGRFNGQGQLTFDDGSRYLGEFRTGAMQGFGRLFSADGQQEFAGQFVDGVPTQATTEPPMTAPVTMPTRPPAPAPAPEPPPITRPAPPPVAAPVAPSTPLPPLVTQPVPPMQQPVRQEGGYATGRVTLPDGSPLPPSVENVSISIVGISSAGVNVRYQPIVRPDGTYRQQLVPGAYRFSSVWRGVSGTVTVRHQGRIFELPLEPVGNQWSKNQDAADGIVQNFVWKPTGPTPGGIQDGLSPSTHTHWFGMAIATEPGGWLADFYPTDHFTRGLRPTPVPERTKITMTLRPLTPSIDGRALSDTTIERDIDRMGPDGGNTYRVRTVTFHDLPPADYELTGFATLPSGSRHTLFFRGTEADRLGYVRAARVNPERGTFGQGFDTRTLVYYFEGNCPVPTHPTCASDGGARAGTPAAGNPPAGNPPAGMVVGARVEISYSGTWYPGVIKAVQGQNQWLVGYDGWSSSWDEVVGADRIRLPNP